MGGRSTILYGTYYYISLCRPSEGIGSRLWLVVVEKPSTIPLPFTTATTDHIQSLDPELEWLACALAFAVHVQSRPVKLDKEITTQSWGRVCQSHNDNYTYLSTKAQSSAQGLEHKSRPLIINMIRWLFRARTETYLAISPLARAQKGILCDLVPPMVTSRIWLLGVGGVTSCHAAIRARWKESRSTDSRWALVRFIVPNFRRILEREIESDSFRNWFG